MVLIQADLRCAELKHTDGVTNPVRQVSALKSRSSSAKRGSALKEPTASLFTSKGPDREKTFASILGEITWLMTQSPRHKNFFLSDLEWMAMAPVMLKQFRMFHTEDRPLGVALWAFVDGEVSARLAAGNAKMRPQDWKCGDQLWVADIVAPYGGQDEMMKDLKQNVFPDQTIRYLGMVDGKPGVKEV